MYYNYIWLYFFVINGLGFLLVALDKIKAKQKRRRVPEKRFFIFGFLGGALGVYIGMQLFRHKTRHRKFTYGISIMIIINLLILYFALKEF